MVIDPGSVKLVFIVRNKRTGATLYKREEDVQRPSSTVLFGSASTREEIQEAVF